MLEEIAIRVDFPCSRTGCMTSTTHVGASEAVSKIFQMTPTRASLTHPTCSMISCVGHPMYVTSVDIWNDISLSLVVGGLASTLGFAAVSLLQSPMARGFLCPVVL